VLSKRKKVKWKKEEERKEVYVVMDAALLLAMIVVQAIILNSPSVATLIIQIHIDVCTHRFMYI
jgi:hypothetical protein